mgnify:CR=1 FL=1
MKPQDSPTTARPTGAITRRRALGWGLLGAAGMALSKPLGLLAGTPDHAATSGSARSVIQIWMWGGPSHLDTFDPKPDAGRDYCGPLTNPIETNVDGIMIGELLPMLAKQADKYSIIRSMTHGINAHETASYLVQTGHQPGRLVYPCIGAVVGLLKGHGRAYEGKIPPYIVLTKPQGRFSEAGFLGPEYKPFATGGDPNRDPFVVEGIVAKGISDERQRKRRTLLHALDTLGRAMPGNPRFARTDRSEGSSYNLMFGRARKLFDLSNETEETRERYGRNTFGQSCLTARRLVEYGVPYVTINYPGWDTHKQHFQTVEQKLPEMDRGMAVLLEDLADRGMLDSTIVWWSGEFGRGPKVQWAPPWNGGRSHYGQCFSAVLAGGGFKGGRVVGASNAHGTQVTGRPVHPQNLLGSIYELMGIDPDAPLPNERGLDVSIMPDADRGEGRLREIM